MYLRHRENDFILSIGCFSFLLLLFDVMGTEIHAEIPEGGLSGAYASWGKHGESVAVFCWGGGWAFYFINETTSRYTRSTAIKIHARALLYLLSSFFYSLV